MFRLGTGALYASSWTRGPRFARPARVRPPLKRPIPLEEFIMRPWMDRAMLRGRIHGRLMLVLVAVVVLVSAAAVWQFSALRDDRDPDLADIDGRETLTDPRSHRRTRQSRGEQPGPPSPTASLPPRPPKRRPPAPMRPLRPRDHRSRRHRAAVHRLAHARRAWSESVSVTVTVANTGTDAVAVGRSSSASASDA